MSRKEILAFGVILMAAFALPGSVLPVSAQPVPTEQQALQSEYARVNAVYQATKRDCAAHWDELLNFIGPVNDPMAPRDEACAGLKVAGLPPAQNQGWASCSDAVFANYEAKRMAYRQCYNEEDRLGQEKLELYRQILARVNRAGGAGGTQTASRPSPQRAQPAVQSNRPGWLGVEISPVEASTAQRQGLVHNAGAYVEGTFTGSPARLAGLLRGDVIVTFDGQPVATPEDILGYAQDIKAGQIVSIDVIRNGAQQTIQVAIQARP